MCVQVGILLLWSQVFLNNVLRSRVAVTDGRVHVVNVIRHDGHVGNEWVEITLKLYQYTLANVLLL